MKREQRLTEKSRYATVHNQGKSWANELLVMKAFPNELEWTRFGFSVSKRVGKAVVRNRVRRVLRECVQHISCKPGWDVVFIARNTASRADFYQLKGAVEQLTWRAKLKEQK
jgi:ribonuclease P protein component